MSFKWVLISVLGGGPEGARTPDVMVAKHIPASLPTFAAVCKGLPTVAISLMGGIF
jgi:hypothetical protein